MTENLQDPLPIADATGAIWPRAAAGLICDVVMQAFRLPGGRLSLYEGVRGSRGAGGRGDAAML